MKLYILTNMFSECNEYKPKVFKTYDEAYSYMKKRCLDTVGDNNSHVIEHELTQMDAYIIYEDETVEYFRIWEVEV